MARGTNPGSQRYRVISEDDLLTGTHRHTCYLMTRPDFQLRAFSPELLPQVALLLRHLWPPDVAFNQRFFEWKCLENPQASAAPGIVALLDGGVVGFRGYFVTSLLGPGRSEPVRILCPGDTCVEPTCRQFGLSVAMGKLASQIFAADFPLFLNTTTTRPSLPGYRKLGFLPLASKSYHSAYRMVDLARYILTYRQRPLPPPTRIRLCQEGHFVVTLQPRADEMALVAQKQRDPWPGLQPLRTAEYFRWRFRNPQGAYVFYYAYDGGEMRGYVVVGLSSNLRRGYLLDFVDVDRASVPDLLARILRRRDLDILSISTASMGSTAIDWRSLGFKPTGLLRRLERRRTGELPLLIRPVVADFDESHWILAGVDTRDVRHWQYREMVSDAF